MLPQFNRYIHKKQHKRLLPPLPPPPPMVTVSLEQYLQYLQRKSYEFYIPTWEPDAKYSWATNDIKTLLGLYSTEAKSATALLVAVEKAEVDFAIRHLWASLGIKKRTVDSVNLLVQLKELEDPPFTPALSAERREEDLLYGMRGLSRAWVEDGNTAECRQHGNIGFEYGDPGSETWHVSADHEGDKYLVITIPVSATSAASLKRKVSDGEGDGDLPPSRKAKLDGAGGAGGAGGSHGGGDGGGGGGGCGGGGGGGEGGGGGGGGGVGREYSPRDRSRSAEEAGMQDQSSKHNAKPPPPTAPGAHDAGIEYGEIAPDIAADNMAAHIAAVTDFG